MIEIGQRQEPGDFIIRTTDGGDNWTPVWQAEPETPPTRVNCISHSPVFPEITYAGLGGSRYFMLKSTDAGMNWFELIGPMGTPGFIVYGIAQQSHRTLYISDFSIYHYGIYRSINGGTNWSEFNEGFSPIPRIACLGIDSSISPSIIYCGTWGSGFARRKIGDVWEYCNDGLAPAHRYIWDMLIDYEEPTLIF